MFLKVFQFLLKKRNFENFDLKKKRSAEVETFWVRFRSKSVKIVILPAAGRRGGAPTAHPCANLCISGFRGLKPVYFRPGFVFDYAPPLLRISS